MANNVFTKLLNYETGVLDNSLGNLTIASSGVANAKLAGSIKAGKLLLQSGVLQDDGSDNVTISASGVTNARASLFISIPSAVLR